MRKTIAALLAILIFLLSCMPCSDALTTCSAGNEQATCENDIRHHGCNNCVGECSPFCQCSCCAGFALPQLYELQLQAVLVFSRKAITDYSKHRLPEVFLPIWQPPQLV